MDYKYKQGYDGLISSYKKAKQQRGKQQNHVVMHEFGKDKAFFQALILFQNKKNIALNGKYWQIEMANIALIQTSDSNFVLPSSCSL